jgi:hypothetical protein
MSILKVLEKRENCIMLGTELPSGKTQQELVEMLDKELPALEPEFYGKIVRINGRLTTAMALYLGHKLAHISKEVEIFDPKENSYVKAVWH